MTTKTIINNIIIWTYYLINLATYYLILPFGWILPISDFGSGEKLLQLVDLQSGIHEHPLRGGSAPSPSWLALVVRQYPSIVQCFATILSIQSSNCAPVFDTLLLHCANSVGSMLGFIVTVLLAFTARGSDRGRLFSCVIGTTKNWFCINTVPPSLGGSVTFTVHTPGLIGLSTFGLWKETNQLASSFMTNVETLSPTGSSQMMLISPGEPPLRRRAATGSSQAPKIPPKLRKMLSFPSHSLPTCSRIDNQVCNVDDHYQIYVMHLL